MTSSLNVVRALLVIVLSLTVATNSRRQSKRCLLPKKQGDCQHSRLKYYFDSDTKECMKFYYTGCNGNRNRFQSLSKCVKSCVPGEPTCPRFRCNIKCVEYALKKSGCPKCKCKRGKPAIIDTSCPVWKCPVQCPRGFQEDMRGCRTCRCVGCSAPKCGPMGTVSCSLGHLRDRSGCELCECITPTLDMGGREGCPPQNCPLQCRHGYAQLPSGCPGCGCNPPPDKQSCGVVTCSSLIGCASGRLQLDRDGCEACECDTTAPCPIPMCSVRCRHGYTVSPQGCQTCSCSPPPGGNTICKELTCPGLACYERFLELDERGCEMCRCAGVPEIHRDPSTGGCKVPFICSLGCFGDFASDAEGCPLCDCKSGRPLARDCVTPPRCDGGGQPCRDGPEYDERGCETCRCAVYTRGPVVEVDPISCPVKSQVCIAIDCPHGFAYDSRGCTTCECAPPLRQGSRVCNEPFCDKVCETGHVYDMFGCLTCECIPSQPESKVSPCPPVVCGQTCRYGYDTDLNGCQICLCRQEPICDEIGASCRLQCPAGLDLDANDCPVCRCKCEPVRCRMSCERGFAVSKETGCMICSCPPPTSNCRGPTPMCYKECPRGYALDTDGCNTCTCLHSPLRKLPQCNAQVLAGCKHTCPNGYLRDENNCRTCHCLSMPCPLIVCTNFCDLGFKKLANGCQTCECVEECPWLRCEDTTSTSCKGGRVKDVNGCDTCECVLSDVECVAVNCTNVKCKYGFSLDEADCPSCQCRVEPVCEREHCTTMCTSYEIDSNGCQTCQCSQMDADCRRGPKCRMSCPYGYRTDRNGCPVCACQDQIKVAVRDEEERVCPSPEPMCDTDCDAYVYDEDNCMTCACIINNPDTLSVNECPHPEPMCAEICDEYIYTSENCMTCKCKQTSRKSESLDTLSVKECPHPEPMCAERCDEYIYTSENCMTCKCKQTSRKSESLDTLSVKECPHPEPMCAERCDEYIYTSENCMTCKCKQTSRKSESLDTLSVKECPHPEPMCAERCDEYIYTSENCMTCKCKRNSKPVGIVSSKVCMEQPCFKFCERYEVDDNNCETCECVSGPDMPTEDPVCNGPEPMCETDCDRYVYDVNNCMTCDCVGGVSKVRAVEDQVVVDERMCQNYRTVCSVDCPNGYVRDTNNCLTCDCLSNPVVQVITTTTAATTMQVKHDCPTMRHCFKLCMNGMQRGSDGCQICECVAIDSTRKRHSMCSQPKKVGPCRMMDYRWYFNTATERCTKFRYGGCKCNMNNFLSESSCKFYCRKRQSTTSWYASIFQLE